MVLLSIKFGLIFLAALAARMVGALIKWPFLYQMSYKQVLGTGYWSNYLIGALFMTLMFIGYKTVYIPWIYLMD